MTTNRRRTAVAVVALPSPSPEAATAAAAEQVADLTGRVRSLVRTFRDRFESAPGAELRDATSPLRSDLEHLVDTIEDAASQAERAADRLAAALPRPRVA